MVPSNDDRLLLRNEFGSGRDEDDKIVSWSLSKFVLCSTVGTHENANIA